MGTGTGGEGDVDGQSIVRGSITRVRFTWDREGMTLRIRRGLAQAPQESANALANIYIKKKKTRECYPS